MRRALVLACLVPAAPSQASEVVRVVPKADGPCEILEYGFYEPISERITHRDDPDATGEWIAVDDIKFVHTTQQIRRELGRSFGFRYRVRGVARDRGLKVTWRIVYPRPFPKWERTFIEYTSNGVLSKHLGFAFEPGWEMTTGSWLFEVLVEGKRACAMRFTVY